MIIGPHALNWMNSSIMDAQWYHILTNVGEILVGMLIGTELIIEELKKSGKQIVTICLFEGMTAFILVAIAFFIFTDMPMFIALDDVLGLIVFFLVIGVVSGGMTGESVNILSILMMIVLPFAIGGVTGYIGSKILKNKCSKIETILKIAILIVITVLIGRYLNNNILSINLLLSGISFSAIIANTVSKERLQEIMGVINPIIGIGLMVMVVDLGAPLDYNLIFGAGIFTAIYIIARGIGKIFGAYAGGKLSKADKNVCKYLGLSLLSHSGVSLIFTGIAVFLAKQAFKMAGEIKV